MQLFSVFSLLSSLLFRSLPLLPFLFFFSSSSLFSFRLFNSTPPFFSLSLFFLSFENYPFFFVEIRIKHRKTAAFPHAMRPLLMSKKRWGFGEGVRSVQGLPLAWWHRAALVWSGKNFLGGPRRQCRRQGKFAYHRPYGVCRHPPMMIKKNSSGGETPFSVDQDRDIIR